MGPESRHRDGTRGAVYDAIERSPGSYPAKIHERTGIPTSTVRYHCRQLVRDGAAKATRIRGKRRLYPIDVDRLELAAALEDDATAAILEAVERMEPVTGTELAEELDRSHSTVSYHLSQLAADGLVDREREGCAVVTCLDPAVRDVLG